VGKAIVSDPTTMLLGPTTTVWPFGSVKVSKPVPIGIVLPSSTMLWEEGDGVGVFPGSIVKVRPSVVITSGVVSDGMAIESVPIIMPLGPMTTVSPFGSVKVSGAVGNGIEVPPIITPGGIVEGVSEGPPPVGRDPDRDVVAL
jgi:hypothetical protein